MLIAPGSSSASPIGPFRRTSLAEGLIRLDGKPFSFNNHPFFRDIYDIEAPEFLLKTARQVGKSVCCANLIALDSISKPHFKTLYITPSQTQTSRFSNTRLTKILRHSPLIRKHFVSPDLTNNVFLQLLTNGAEVYLSYACDDADRIRGISADRELLDEVQDIEFEAVIPVAQECLSNSEYGYVTYAGTPKSMENTIEYLWQRSTRAEWIMKCTGCGKHQFIDSPKAIGKTGPICLHCGKNLSVRDGFWYEFCPGAKIRGFHISQPIMPANAENKKRWDRIINKLETYSPAKFNNEVLGMSDAKGGRMVSLEELQSLCKDYAVTFPPESDYLKDVSFTAGGVDWSGAGSEYTSRTVAWVWGFTKDFKLRTVYFDIMRGDNPIDDVNHVAEIFKACNCRAVVGDAGMGQHANAMLKEILGPHVMFQAQYGAYGSFTIRWNKRDRFLVDRTAAIDSMMLKLKQKAVIFPVLPQMRVPINDILNEYEEMTQEGTRTGGRRVWRHSPTAPDDCLHAMTFGLLAVRIAQGEVRMYEVETEDYD